MQRGHVPETQHIQFAGHTRARDAGVSEQARVFRQQSSIAARTRNLRDASKLSLRQVERSGYIWAPACRSFIIPIICASVRRLFSYSRGSFAVEQPLHQTEGSRGGGSSVSGHKRRTPRRDFDRSRSGFTIQIHLRVNAAGQLVSTEIAAVRPPTIRGSIWPWPIICRNQTSCCVGGQKLRC